MRPRRWWKIALGILLLFLAPLVYAAWPGSSTFTVSPETTYITEPLDKDGYPDYVTALNQRLSQGVTPENNANVLIWQALGPHMQGERRPAADYFNRLGIETLPAQGDYFATFGNNQALKDLDREKKEQLLDRSFE